MFTWIWTAVIVLALIVEAATVELVSIWFGAGALIALILELCGVVWWVQLIVFAVVSIALILGLRSVCVKILKNNHEKTNTETLIGKKVELLTSITKRKAGTCKVNDVVWNCVSDAEIAAGTEVEIVKIEGNKFIVKGE